MATTTVLIGPSSSRKSCQDCRTRHLKCLHIKTRATSAREKAASRPILPRVRSLSTESDHKQHKRSSLEVIVASPTSSHELLLLSEFNRIIAPWFDLFDEKSTFVNNLPILAYGSRMLTCACLAYAELRKNSLTSTTGQSSFLITSNHYYKEATSRLAQALAILDPVNPCFTSTILATALVLCGCNMFEDYFEDWKLHLNGISAMLNVARTPQDQFSRSVFWVFVREDTVRSWSQDNIPLLAPALWPDPDPKSGECYLANRTLKLLSSILSNRRKDNEKSNCRNRPSSRKSASPHEDNIEGPVRSRLLMELTVLEDRCDKEFLTLAELSIMDDDNLPYILKASSRQSSTLQMLHSCRLLLSLDASERVHHAIKIIALVAAGLDEPCMLHSVQPLFLAGRHLCRPSIVPDTILHKFRGVIIGELSRIQTQTGWKTKSKRERLFQLWNLDKS